MSSGIRGLTCGLPTWCVVVNFSIDLACDCACLEAVVVFCKGGVDASERRNAVSQGCREYHSTQRDSRWDAKKNGTT